MALRGLQSLSRTLLRFSSSSALPMHEGPLLNLPHQCSTKCLPANAVALAHVLPPFRPIHSSAQLRSDDASKAQNGERVQALEHELEEMKREMDEFFGVHVHEPAIGSDPGVTASQGDDNGFTYRPQEPRPAMPQHPEPVTSGRLTHIDKDGRASMVDVAKVYHLVASNSIRKGDVLTVAELAGIMAAKHTSTLIPLCHNLPLSYVDVKLKLLDDEESVGVTAEVRTVGTTGVEMEALTAASVAALTIYDMCKAVSRRLEIHDVRLEKKTGGKSGTFIREGDA